MLRKLLLTIGTVFFFQAGIAQKDRDSLAIDTSFFDYTELFSELDALIDSLSAPRSFTLINLGVSQNCFTYQSSKGGTSETKHRFIYSPSVSYFDRSGLGISAGASLANDGTGINPFQFSLSGSYDYQKNKAFVAGLLFSYYFTKNNLPFYTSPLQKEVYAYFTHRQLWFKPTIGVSYGWGGRKDYEEREERIQRINLARRGFTRINTTESIRDLNLLTSVRHDFYFLDLLSSDYIRITPQISFVSGTQQFGFNQTANSFVTIRRTGRNVLYASENIVLDESLHFQPLSLTGFFKAEYAKGKFYIQPQFLADYYFPATAGNFSTGFLLSAGLLF